MTARSVGRFFKICGNSLERAYKHHLSGFGQWDQKEHAEDWMLLAENFDERMSIDETMLCDDLFTFFSRKAGKGRKGTLAAVVRGTTAGEVVKVLMQVPEEIRRRVNEVTMDFSDLQAGAEDGDCLQPCAQAAQSLQEQDCTGGCQAETRRVVQGCREKPCQGTHIGKRHHTAERDRDSQLFHQQVNKRIG